MKKFYPQNEDQILSGTKNFFIRRNTWINGGIFLQYLDPTSHNPQPSQDPDHQHTSRHKHQKSAARSTISSIDEHQWCPNGPITAAEHVRPLLWKVGTDLEISWINDCVCYFGGAGYSVGLYGASSSGKRFGPLFEDKKSCVDPEILHKKFYPQKEDQIRSTVILQRPFSLFHFSDNNQFNHGSLFIRHRPHLSIYTIVTWQSFSLRVLRNFVCRPLASALG